MQNYLSFLGHAEDLQALFGLRLGTSRQARSSTDITCVLQMLANAAGVESVSQLEALLNITIAGERFDDGYLKQYINSGRGWARGRAKHKLMRIGAYESGGTASGVLALIQAALQAKIIDGLRAGALLRGFDREDVLGALAKAWRVKKRAYPTTIKAWLEVWSMAEIQSQVVWNRRPEWHKALVIASLGPLHEVDAGASAEMGKLQAIVRTVLSDSGESHTVEAEPIEESSGVDDVGDRVPIRHKVGDMVMASAASLQTMTDDCELEYEEEGFRLYALRTMASP